MKTLGTDRSRHVASALGAHIVNQADWLFFSPPKGPRGIRAFSIAARWHRRAVARSFQSSTCGSIGD